MAGQDSESVSLAHCLSTDLGTLASKRSLAFDARI